MAMSMSASMAQSQILSYMEGPVPEFVSLDDKFLCVACKQLLRHPQQTLCGHRICAECVDNLLKDKEAVMCPGGDEYCEEITRTSVYPDMATSREMSRLKVYCPYRSYGCKVETQWSKLRDHKEGCEYAVEDCPYREFGCMEMIPSSQKAAHAKSCSYQPQTCPHCSLSIAKCRMEVHLSQECERAPIPCPWKCGEQSIIRAELKEHRAVCRAKPKECPYKSAGCTFLGSESEIQEHQGQMKVHLELLLKQHAKDQQEMTKLTQTLKDMETGVAEMRNELTKTLAENAQLVKKIDFFETKVNRLERSVGEGTRDMISVQEKLREQETSVSSHEKKLTDTGGRLSTLDRKITELEQKGVGGSSRLSPEMNTKVMQIENKQNQMDIRLQEVNQRFQHTETTTYDGTLIWKITDYHRRKQEAVSGTNVSLYSQPFYSSRFGYKMCLRVYLNGDGIGRNTHMSLFFVLMKGEYDALLKWPFAPKVTLTLMDQERGIKPLSDTFRPDPTSSSFARPRLDMNIASGCPLFVAHSQLEASSFLKDNTLFIKCVLGETDTTGL